MKNQELLRVDLADFLKTNGHGLLDSCDELRWWNLFLNYVAGFLETNSFETRGSCIAQTVIETLAKEPTENDWDDTDVKLVLTPYIMVSNYLSEDLKNKELSPVEIAFIQFITQATRKRNIDIYIQLNNTDDVAFYAQAFQKSFIDPKLIAISDVTIHPNGIASLHVDVQHGYFTHEVVIAFKPPLDKDLRKNMSKRQLASKGKIVREDNNWYLLVEQENITQILNEDEVVFTDEDLSFAEILLQSARTLRFNAIYTPNNKTLLSFDKVKRLAQAISKSHEPQDNENESYILKETINEFMLAFLHNPDLFISFMLELPTNFFPFINRAAVIENRDKICQLLANKPKDYFSTPKDEHLNLTEILTLLVGKSSESLQNSKVFQRYSDTIESIDTKINLTEMLSQQDSHTSWYFEQYTDFYYFFMLFYPLDLL